MNVMRSLTARPWPLRLVLAAGLFASACAAGAAVEPRPSLGSAAATLAVAARARQLAFVEAAVAELDVAYRALARRAAAGNAGRWAARARAFSARLEAIAAAARAGGAIRILIEAGGVVRVVVGARPARQFMITAPDARGGPALERAILRRFCRLDGCGRTAPAQAADADSVVGKARQPIAGEAARPLDRGGGIAVALPSGDDGLRCRASAVPHARLYASACTQLLTEARALAVAAHAAARRGAAIDWTSLAMPARAAAPAELVFDARGDKLALPGLARSPELRAALVPWLQDRLRGIVRTLAFDPPARLVYASR